MEQNYERRQRNNLELWLPELKLKYQHCIAVDEMSLCRNDLVQRLIHCDTMEQGLLHSGTVEYGHQRTYI